MPEYWPKGSSVGFVVARGSTGFAPDDVPAAEALRARGLTVAPADWSDPAVRWEAFDALILRSCHDYVLDPGAFELWLDHVGRGGVQLWNPPSPVRETLDKKYLLQLAAGGVTILPTLRIDPATPVDLPEVLDRSGWGEAVIKPAVSASARATFRVSRRLAPAFQPQLDHLLASGPVLIQAFAPEITAHGEWSIVFFDRLYSHAVLKRPSVGDFRVQTRYGGDARAASAPPDVVGQAADVLDRITGPLLYARVDGVIANGRFVLCELELIEPCLYFRLTPGAADTFANALVGLVGRLPPSSPSEPR
ncbi:MAG TPA: hypothetical protein VD866_01375 [Urbifossiella sp.]|nr:hypothetical protein [Urbifossiella sp.]